MKSKLASLRLLLLMYLYHGGITSVHGAELIQTFEIKEGSPAGTVVGTIGNDQSGSLIVGERGSAPPEPPYLIVPQVGFDEGGGGEDLIINEQTGEIRTKRLLDREVTSAYVLNAIPLNGDNIKVRKHKPLPTFVMHDKYLSCFRLGVLCSVSVRSTLRCSLLGCD